MSNDTDEQIKNRLKSIFPDPITAAAVVDLVVHSKPPGWGRKSNAPYYAEKFGLMMKKEIDKMIETGNEIIWRYAKWCDEGGMSEQTLYTMVNQSIRFLLDKMDPNRYYYAWRQRIKTERKAGLGVRIFFIPGLGPNNDTPFTADAAEPKEYMPKWKQKMEDWLESDDMQPFCYEGLALTPQEIADLKVSFEQLRPHIESSITSASIKIIKMG